MKKLLAVASLVSVMGAPAFAQIGYWNQDANAYVRQRISANLNRLNYDGVSPDGSPCRVQVNNLGHQIEVRGMFVVPGRPIQPTPVTKAMFQIGLANMSQVTSFQETADMLSVSTRVRLENMGVIIVGGNTRSSLTLAKKGHGVVSAIKVQETTYYPYYDQTFTRTYVCSDPS